MYGYCYIFLFRGKQARLINPFKTELGLVCNDLIHRITSKIVSSSKYNQWKNFLDTIDLFRNIKNKRSIAFIQFNIIEFYSSINRKLLLKSLNNVREYVGYQRRGSTSSCRATSSDLPDPLSPPMSIVHCSREVFKVISRSGTELLSIGSS